MILRSCNIEDNQAKFVVVGAMAWYSTLLLDISQVVAVEAMARYSALLLITTVHCLLAMLYKAECIFQVVDSPHRACAVLELLKLT